MAVRNRKWGVHPISVFCAHESQEGLGTVKELAELEAQCITPKAIKAARITPMMLSPAMQPEAMGIV
jgi:hypothetical protein